jgi:DNA modification methylase
MWVLLYYLLLTGDFALTITIKIGDCLEVLKKMPDESVHCCITSPPYYGLRSYLPKNSEEKGYEVGLELTPQAYVDKLVNIFREVRRVLRSDGTCWLNLGDSYSSHKDSKSVPQSLASGTARESAHVVPYGEARTRDAKMLKEEGYKNKDLMGIPWKVANALREDGWWLRSDIIWSKLNGLPESVKDRPTRSHEHIFLLTKAERYFYDYKSVELPIDGEEGTKNLRDVWSVASDSFSGAHFATFPIQLIEPCIKAGTSKKGCCSACGAPWSPLIVNGTLRSWKQDCECDTKTIKPCIVLDPFAGSGTVGELALIHDRDAVLIELNPAYKQFIENRLYKNAAFTGISLGNETTYSPTLNEYIEDCEVTENHLIW